jgi:hypothetical protein
MGPPEIDRLYCKSGGDNDLRQAWPVVKMGRGWYTSGLLNQRSGRDMHGLRLWRTGPWRRPGCGVLGDDAERDATRSRYRGTWHAPP